MSRSSLYEDDILLWSERQAAAIRRLGERPNLVPNDLDIENVAEEIESVGRSELAAVKSYLRVIFLHFLKMVAEPDSQAVVHWRSEIAGFHAEMRDRYSPSMRQRIDLDALWRSAREQAMLAFGEAQNARFAAIPEACPLALDDLLAERFDSSALANRLGAIVHPDNG
jgi:Domain of unknown function DUF29